MSENPYEHNHDGVEISPEEKVLNCDACAWEWGHDARNEEVAYLEKIRCEANEHWQKEVATLTAKLQEANGKLEPSPCNVPGHLRVHWVMKDVNYFEVSPGGQKKHVFGEESCTLCSAIAKAKDDALVEAAKAVDAMVSPIPSGHRGARVSSDLNSRAVCDKILSLRRPL